MNRSKHTKCVRAHDASALAAAQRSRSWCTTASSTYRWGTPLQMASSSRQKPHRSGYARQLPWEQHGTRIAAPPPHNGGLHTRPTLHARQRPLQPCGLEPMIMSMHAGRVAVRRRHARRGRRQPAADRDGAGHCPTPGTPPWSRRQTSCVRRKAGRLRRRHTQQQCSMSWPTLILRKLCLPACCVTSVSSSEGRARLGTPQVASKLYRVGLLATTLS